ncbi:MULTISPECIES: hypothetical protein [unclassified Escherichia]|uniref:hypothetical protein n=1 Tax=unclassified Escherichia TaxID=2608889 RepID=UPI000CF799CA|nr:MULTISPECIES: hypothetical protein [unclassified Escherichia]HAW2529900.1 hypothetical protein [Escherichia coli]HBE4722443.1 hypothetical protein [Escherichia coli]
MPSTSTKKEMAVSDVLYALSTICDGAMMRMKVLHEAYGKSHDEAAKECLNEIVDFIDSHRSLIALDNQPQAEECQEREYKTIYGNKFSCLSELAAKVADILENNGGRMRQVSYRSEYEALIMLVDQLVDTGALQLNCVRLSGHPIKMNGRI